MFATNKCSLRWSRMEIDLTCLHNPIKKVGNKFSWFRPDESQP